MRSLRILFGVVLLVAASFCGFVLTGDMLAATDPAAGNRQRGETALVVQTRPAELLCFAETVEAVGSTLARHAVTLHPSASGRVDEVLFSAGQRVQEGDLLVRLDDAGARAALASAEATVAEAETAFARLERLQTTGSVTEANLEAARATLLRANAERDMAATVLRDRSLVAPFDGVVGLSDLARGQLVDSSTEVTTLDDLSVIQVAFAVPERYYARLQRGQAVALTSPAFPDRSFTGTISAMATRVDQTTRSVGLRAEVPNEDGLLTAGMYMQATLTLDEHEAPAVPERALSVSGGTSYVHVVRDGVARRIAVTTGRLRDGMIEVEGLEPGAAVIVTNLQRLSDGDPVEIEPLRQVEAGR
ncbi:efflux transporter, RND family, MFP subunit [Citreicella sp. SE45]|nr:efflux transporter, RND family, MFP subunit [Citreicella sp. SE45]